MLNEPRCDFVSGVRLLATMTASLIWAPNASYMIGRVRSMADHDSPARIATPDGDARPVRTTEQLDWPRLAAYLRERLPPRTIADLDLSGEMEVEQFPGGHP